MTINGYDVRKAAQVVAYFAKKQGGSINTLKLVKLIYLADRLSLSKYDYPILFDKMVSMEHGPVNSITLNYIKGMSDNADWDAFVSDMGKHLVGLANSRISYDDLDELSDADAEILEDIWNTFGSMDQFQVRDYTHDNCPEWEDPNRSSAPIPYERILKFLGKSNSAAIAEGIEEIRALRAV